MMLDGKRSGHTVMCVCPAHDDGKRSLAVREMDDGKILFKCHAGCDQSTVLDALKSLGLFGGKPTGNAPTQSTPTKTEKKPTKKREPRKLIEVEDYHDFNGDLVYQSLRYEPKSFSQRRPYPFGDGHVYGLTKGKYYRIEGKKDWYSSLPEWAKDKKHDTCEMPECKLYPFKLPEILKSDRAVFICEGERDANALTAWGVTATTSPMGAGKWRNDFNQYFENRDVIILPDNDNQGKNHAGQIAQQLINIAKSIRVIELDVPEKGDVRDWIEAGNTKDDLRQLIKSTIPIGSEPEPEFQPQPEPTPEPGSTTTKPQAIAVPAPKAPASPDYSARVIEWTDTNVKGAPMGTISNTVALLSAYEIIVRYNVMKKDVEIFIPGAKFSQDNAGACSMAFIKSLAIKCSLPVSSLDEYILFIADQNMYNPAQAWISSKGWDGKDRLQALAKTLNSKNETLTFQLLKRWMISAVAAVYEPTGVAAGGALILQGAQGVGKTQWFWSLLGGNNDWGREGAILNPSDRDSVTQAITYWLVELGEIDATFRKADQAALKGFLTNHKDVLRRPYARHDSSYARRTVYVGSVNQKEFLSDDTGARRYWTIEAGQIDYRHGIDMQQAWAQCLSLYSAGEPWHLSFDESVDLAGYNESFLTMSPIEEKILSTFDPEATERPNEMTCTAILSAIGIESPNRGQVRECGQIMRKLLKEDAKHTRNGKTFRMPFKLQKTI